MEYELVLNKVCENDKKRLAYMQQGPKRGPASTGSLLSTPDKEKFQQSYHTRCAQK
jgi:hypothetical protein